MEKEREYEQEEQQLEQAIEEARAEDGKLSLSLWRSKISLLPAPKGNDGFPSPLASPSPRSLSRTRSLTSPSSLRSKSPKSSPRSVATDAVSDAMRVLDDVLLTRHTNKKTSRKLMKKIKKLCHRHPEERLKFKAALAFHKAHSQDSSSTRGDESDNIWDLLGAEVHGESLESEVQANLQKMWPFMVICQSLSVLGLFIAGLIWQGNLGYLSRTKSGLDSFTEYPYFDLRLYYDDGMTTYTEADMATHTQACVSLRFQIWRWVTYQFSHIGISHVLTNVFLLVILGIPMEGLHGSLHLFIMFQIGVIGGAWCCFVNALRYPVVGMSGGCYSLFGMHLADLLLNWKHRMYRRVMLFFLFCVGAGSWLTYMYGNPEHENASNEAHVGGAIAGLCIAVVVGYNKEITWLDRFIQVVAILVGLGCGAFALYFGMQFPPRGLWEEEGWCWLRQVWNPVLFNCDPTPGVPCNYRCIRCGTEDCIRNAIKDFTPSAENPWARMKGVNLVECEFGWLTNWNAAHVVAHSAGLGKRHG